MVQPLVTMQSEKEEQVSWPTDKGLLYVGSVNRDDQDRLDIRFRVETAAGISAQPVYVPPDPRILPESGIIITGSRDAFVHAIKEKDGSALWRFSAGDPIVEAPVVIGLEPVRSRRSSAACSAWTRKAATSAGGRRRSCGSWRRARIASTRSTSSARWPC